jgi:large subunit ribosomal protein L4e
VNQKAGMKHSAESWGTGRAVARVPRVSGSGTNRTGQGAFANSCRKGRMAFPLQTWRRWHRKVNLRQRRNALASAIAATAVPSLVLAHGHRILKVPQFPLVLDDKVGSISKTQEAVALLKRFGAYEDVLRCIKAKKMRAGKGKLRNRRYKLRRGPLFIVNDESVSLTRALRNIPGVNTVHVKRLNIRHLAPGSQVGRFAIYTEAAFRELENQFGSFKAPGSGRKNYLLKKEVIVNSDISGIINSDEVQRVLRSKKSVKPLHYKQKKNPLRNKGEMKKLNPYAPILREKKALENATKVKKIRKERKAHTKKSGEAIRTIETKITDTQNTQNAEYKRLMIETRV